MIRDQKTYQRVAKEHSALTPIVRLIRKCQTVQAQIDGNRILLNDSDPEIRALAKEEIDSLRRNLAETEEELKIKLLPKDPNDDKNILLEIRAGTGGDEAALFAADLFRMYTRYAELKGWKTEVLSVHPTGIGGFKEIIVLIEGDRVYSR